MRGGQRNSGTLAPRLSGDVSGQTRSFRTHDGGIVNSHRGPRRSGRAGEANPWENFGAPTMKEERRKTRTQATIVWFPEDTSTTFQVAKIHARMIKFHKKNTFFNLSHTKK